MGVENNGTFGRFEIIEWLGKGSQGIVYLARDPSLDRKVAVKLLVGDPAALDGIPEDDALKEGRLASRLTHPNIIPVFEAGEHSGMNFLVFEYVRGETLHEVIEKRGGLSLPSACELIGPILDGIAHAHARGVVHLDLSPRNILVDDAGVPRIMDFGLAQTADGVRTPTDSAAGTLRYMTPEHLEGGEFGPYSDVFSLGLIFVELVTGVPVMRGRAAQSVMSRIIAASVDYTELLQKKDGAAFVRFIQGALQRDCRRRYPDGEAMKAAFDAFRQTAGLSPTSSGSSTIDYLMRRMRRKGDFPSLSRNLLDLNRLTDEDADAPADKVANVILRDYALTNKLLKLVNSAFYQTVAGEVSNISQAIVLLGFKQVRMAANSLAFFSHMRDKEGSTELRDAMTRAFLAGLLTRHLAREVLPVCPEDAFICGMFHSLGECLVAYYFTEEYREICDLVSSGAGHRDRVAKTVLGVGFGELGSRVAYSWNLPEAVVEIIASQLAGPVGKPGNHHESLRDIVILCNELGDIAGRDDPRGQQAALHDLLRHYAASIGLSEAATLKLLAAALAKLEQFAPILELDLEAGNFLRSAHNWVNARAAQQDDAPPRLLEQTAS